VPKRSASAADACGSTTATPGRAARVAAVAQEHIQLDLVVARPIEQGTGREPGPSDLTSSGFFTPVDVLPEGRIVSKEIAERVALLSAGRIYARNSDKTSATSGRPGTPCVSPSACWIFQSNATYMSTGNCSRTPMSGVFPCFAKDSLISRLTLESTYRQIALSSERERPFPANKRSDNSQSGMISENDSITC
jgi:hypothetical protein